MPLSDDLRFLKRALQLTNRVATHPSPGVGAVVVRDGQIVGEGWTYGTHQVHAEAMALAQAGEQARGATLYTTLEPCSHWERPDGTRRYPCSQYLVDYGIARVVCPITDPNPLVSGEGFAFLRAAGVEVEIGLLATEATEAHRAFLKHQTTGLPWVLHKAAMTLDGKLAARRDTPLAITGEPARRAVHRLRSQSDAVVVGVGTVLADNPRLDVRLVKGRSPVPVVFDTHLRTPLDAHVVRPGAVLVTATSAAPEHQARGMEVVTVPVGTEGRIAVLVALRLLAERGLIALLLESGGELAAAFHAARAVDRVLFFVAPKLIGGASAPTPLEGEGLGGPVPLTNLRVRRYGEDIALEGEIDVHGNR